MDYSISKRNCEDILSKINNMENRLLIDKTQIEDRQISMRSPETTSEKVKTIELKFSVDRLLSDDHKKDDRDLNKQCCDRLNYGHFQYSLSQNHPLFFNPGQLVRRSGEDYPISDYDLYPSKSILRPMPMRIINRGGDHGGLSGYGIQNGSFPVFRLNQLFPQPKFLPPLPLPGHNPTILPQKPHFSPTSVSQPEDRRSDTSSTNGTKNAAKRKRSWSRAVFSNLQRKGLEIAFGGQKYITKPDRRKLAARLGLTDAQVKVWFQNRRMKWRHTGGEDRKGTAESKGKLATNKKGFNNTEEAEKMSSDSETDDVEDEIDVLMD